MNPEHAADTINLLHIRYDASEPDARRVVEEMLDACPVKIGTAADVYRGMALLGGKTAAWPKAIIVNLDGLGPAEYEFFPIAARRFPEVRIYVYGSIRTASEIERAIQGGATGELTDEVLAALTDHAQDQEERFVQDDQDHPREITQSEMSPPEANYPQPQIVPPETESTVPDTHETALDEANDIDTMGQPLMPQPDIGVDEDTETARVPWKTYDNDPKRSAPSSRKPPDFDGGDEALAEPPVTPPSKPLPDHTPLLTEEELQALLGDDIAAIAPDDPVEPFAEGDDV